MIIGFVIWSITAVLFLGIGLWSRKSEKAVGFFSNTNPPEVTDTAKYNKAVSVIWFAFAIILELLGLPLLFLKQNSSLFIIVVLGTVFLVIGIIIAYIRIEGKYRIK